MGAIDKIARCKWPAAADEASPQLRRHWLYEAGILNRAFGDFIFRVAEDGVTGSDFEDGSIPESKLAATLVEDLSVADGAVTTRKLQNAVLPDSAGGRVKMADLFLTTAKIADAQVTAAKFDAGVNAFAPPIGMIGKFAGEVAPENWLECNGAVVAIASYPALYSVLGTFWGTATTGNFRLPDLRGYFTRGWDHAAANDPDRASRTGGDHVGSTQAGAFKSHQHQQLGANMLGTLRNVAGGALQQPYASTYNGSHNTLNNTGSETRPKNKAVMYCIRAR